MTIGDGISRRLGAKLGMRQSCLYLQSFIALCISKNGEKRRKKITLPESESNQRLLEYKTGMLTTTQGTWLTSWLRKSECVVSPAL